MVKIKRSPKPEKYNIQSNEFFEVLVKDCYDKCYICEQRNFRDAQKEHIIAHLNNDPKLENDWNNILLACSTCNNIKRTSRIIDCTDIDPEKYIKLRYERNNFGHQDNILVEVRDKNKGTDFLTETIEILTKVYNSVDLANKNRASRVLRDEVKEELSKFRNDLITYITEPDEAIKKSHFNKIKKLIQIDTQFAAFKRQIIRDNPMLSSEFATTLNA